MKQRKKFLRFNSFLLYGHNGSATWSPDPKLKFTIQVEDIMNHAFIFFPRVKVEKKIIFFLAYEAPVWKDSYYASNHKRLQLAL